MRMIAAMTLALLPMAVAATPSRPVAHPADAAAPAKCDPFARGQQAAVLRQSGPRAQRLDQLPPGDLQLTVDRQIDGCHQPTVVRQNFGGAAFRPH